MLPKDYCVEELGYLWVGEGALGPKPPGCDGACECCKPLITGDCVLKDFLEKNWTKCEDDIYVDSYNRHDRSDGLCGSAENPCKTINEAIAKLNEAIAVTNATCSGKIIIEGEFTMKESIEIR